MGHLLSADERDGYIVGDDESHIGLRNRTGEYHCFLNVCIQSLWHLKPFRERFNSLSYTHTHAAAAPGPCVICSLQEVFLNYRYSYEKIVPPDVLRVALDAAFHSRQFSLYHMADADEALSALLGILHADQTGLPHTAQRNDKAVPCTPRCISHTVFGLQRVDVAVCGQCGANGDPVVSDETMYRVFMSELEQFRDLPGTKMYCLDDAMQMVLGSESGPCPRAESDGPCDGISQPRRFIVGDVPEVLCISFAWTTMQASREEMGFAMSMIADEFDLRKLFKIQEQTRPKEIKPYKLRGLICYYGRHWVAFFKSSIIGEWLIFDDSRVQRIGVWEDVVQRTLKGKLQPVVIFYENQHVDVTASISLAKSMLASSAPPATPSAAAADVSPASSAAPSAPPPDECYSGATLPLADTFDCPEAPSEAFAERVGNAVGGLIRGASGSSLYERVEATQPHVCKKCNKSDDSGIGLCVDCDLLD